MLDVGDPVERLHRRQPGGHLADEQDVLAAVTRDPERRVPSLRGRAAAARERGGDGRESEAAPHGNAFDRTAPLSVARTSNPRWRPTHATADRVRAVRLLPHVENRTGRGRPCPGILTEKTR